MKKKYIIIIILFSFLQNVFNNLGHPVTPSFLGFLEIPKFMFGFYYASMSLGMMIGALFWGSLGDTRKNGKLILLGLTIYGLSQIGFGFSHNQYIMILFRLTGGFGIAAPMTLFVSLCIGHAKENRAKYLAYLAAFSTLGISVGYQLGGLLGDSAFFNNLIKTNSHENVFLFQSFTCIGLGILSYFFIADYNTDSKIVKRKNPFASLGKIKSIHPSLLVFLISLTFITIASTNLSKYLDVYFNDLGHNSTKLGTFVLVTGIVAVLTSLFIVPFMTKIKKRLPFIAILQILSAIIVLFVFRAKANKFILVIYTVYNVYIVLKSIYLPMEQNYISNGADNDSIGTIMGIRQSFLSIGNVIGPILGGFLYDIKPIVLFDSSAVFFILGALLIVIVMLLERKKHIYLEK